MDCQRQKIKPEKLFTAGFFCYKNPDGDIDLSFLRSSKKEEEPETSKTDEKVTEKPTLSPEGFPIEKPKEEPGKKGEEKPKEVKEEKKDVINGITFPKRAPDAMTGTQVKKALIGCGDNPTCRLGVIAEQAMKGAFSPDFMKPKKVKTRIGQDDVEVMVHNGIAFGKAGDTFKPDLTPQETQMLADALGCKLPTKKLMKYLYKEAYNGKIPIVDFRYGAEHQHDVNTDPDRAGKSPLIFHTYIMKNGKKVQVPSEAMKMTEFTAAKDKYTKLQLNQKGIPFDALFLGDSKTVCEAMGTESTNMCFYGGIYPEPNRKVVQEHDAHGSNHRDYAQDSWLRVGKMIINGKEVSDDEIRTNPRYAAIAEEFFNKQEGRYQIGDAEKKIAQQIRQRIVGEGGETLNVVASTDATPAADALVPPSNLPKPEEPPILAQNNAPQLPDAAPITPPAASSAGYSGGGGYGGGSGGYQPASYNSPSSSSGSSQEYTPPSVSSDSNEPSSPTQAHAPKLAEGRQEMPKGTRCVTVGDSYTTGYIEHLRQRGASIADPPEEKDRTYEVGMHSQTAMNRFKKFINANKGTLKNVPVFICIGGNDAFAPGIPAEGTKGKITGTIDNIKEMCRIAKDEGMKIILATVPPVGYGTVAAGARSPEKADAHIRAVNEWITGEEARGLTDQVVDLYGMLSDGTGHYRSDIKVAKDGIHLGSEGYAFVADQLVAGFNAMNGNSSRSSSTSLASAPTAETPKDDPDDLKGLSKRLPRVAGFAPVGQEEVTKDMTKAAIGFLSKNRALKAKGIPFNQLQYGKTDPLPPGPDGRKFILYLGIHAPNEHNRYWHPGVEVWGEIKKPSKDSIA